MSSNFPPGVHEGMIPGNRPEDIWYERFTENIKIPSGLNYCDPLLLADLVTAFLGTLQRMNADAFKAGLEEGRLQAYGELADKSGGDSEA